MNGKEYLHSVIVILCCLYGECSDVKANLGEVKNFSAEFGKSVQITCILTSGTINQANLRQWYENSDLIINDGTLVNTNSGYSESVGSTSFTLNTPAVNYSFVGYKYVCRYLFDDANFYLTKIVKPASTEDCTGSFHCGFWLLMLVVASSITICILIQLKVKIFGGFCIVKIVIIVIFSVVAIGIGLGLGLGLRKGGGNCLDCGPTIGISISLGVALSVIQFIVIIKYGKGKGCDGNSEGTPASATGINLEAKKKSQNKPTEKGTGASSLTAKTFGHPLPETPNARKNQLEPLKTDSFEVENSTNEKKKKKKKKKKRETSEGNEASEEKEERQELEF